MKAHLRLLLLTLSLSYLAACSSKHKVQEIETQLENKETVVGQEQVGVKDGLMVVQKKVNMAEELRRIQYDTYGLEDRIYGNPKYGSLGLYGVLRRCKNDLSDKALGGDGKVIWQEPLERVIKDEDNFNVGLDEEQRLVGVSEEYLKDRISRFKEYQKVLSSRRDEYEEKVLVCQSELKARKHEYLQAGNSN